MPLRKAAQKKQNQNQNPFNGMRSRTPKGAQCMIRNGRIVRGGNVHIFLASPESGSELETNQLKLSGFLPYPDSISVPPTLKHSELVQDRHQWMNNYTSSDLTYLNLSLTKQNGFNHLASRTKRNTQKQPTTEKKKRDD